MVNFSLQANATTLDAALDSLRRTISDWTPAWPRVAEAVRSMVREQFETEGARGTSGKWTPLVPDYAKAKRRTYPGKTILRASERLYNSLAGSGTDRLLESGPKRLAIGTRVGYAIYHQSGAPRGKLPRRPIFDFLRGVDDRTISEALMRYASEVARRTGLKAG